MFVGYYGMADNVRFIMEGPEAVAVGDQFRLGFTLNESGTELQWGDGRGPREPAGRALRPKGP